MLLTTSLSIQLEPRLDTRHDLALFFTRRVGVGLRGSDFMNIRHSQPQRFTIHEQTQHTHTADRRNQLDALKTTRKARDDGDENTATLHRNQQNQQKRCSNDPFSHARDMSFFSLSKSKPITSQMGRSLQKRTWPNKETARACTLGQKQIRSVCTES